MKFLIIADLHGNFEVLNKLDKEFSLCDAVLFAGDFADAIKGLSGEPVLKTLLTKHKNIYAVLGNHDSPSFIDALNSASINVEKSVKRCGPYLVTGSGGATFFTHDTPFEREEKEIMQDFDAYLKVKAANFVAKDTKTPPLILLSHNPPLNTICDKVTPTVHAGSSLLVAFIKKVSPLVVVTGHIHEGVGVDKIGETSIINSGSLGLSGTYATMETLEGEHCSVKEIKIKRI